MSDVFGNIKDLINEESGDIGVLVVSDSTAAEPASGVPSWPRRFCDSLAAEYPTRTVKYHIIPDAATPVWEPGLVVSTGSGPHAIEVWNASEDGWWSGIFIDDSPAGATDLLDVSADAAIISLGKNEYKGTGYEGLFARYGELSDLIEAANPGVEVFVTNQNPRLSPVIEPHRATIEFASSRGQPLLPVYDVWIAEGDYSSWMIDDAHPNSDGQEIWTQSLFSWWIDGVGVKL